MAKIKKTGRHTSALKAHRQSETHRLGNVQMRSRIRSIARKVETAVAGKDAKAATEFLNQAFAIWDKASKKGVIHANAASRKKARLAQRVQRLVSAKA